MFTPFPIRLDFLRIRTLTCHLNHILSCHLPIALPSVGIPSECDRKPLGIYLSLPTFPSSFQSQDVYSSYKDVPRETFAEVLLRTGKLAEAKTEGQTPFPATEGRCYATKPSHVTDIHLYGGHFNAK